jgi:cyclopropane-fatty-acyl-phospholipid synthase
MLFEYLQKHWQGPALHIELEGKRRVIGQGTPRMTIIVYHPRSLWRLPFSPSLAFGEAYMRGDLEVQGSLEDLLEGFYRSYQGFEKTPLARVLQLWKRGTGSIGVRQAIKNAQHHYDIGNEFYKLWLDPSLTYSCAYFFHENDSLEKAQEQKRELLCRKLRLKPGQTVLDIGCGWGALLFHMAEKYNVMATGITPAEEQANYIETEAKRRGLQDKIKVIRGDWRSLTGSYDRIVSVGMFEHVGQAQYAEFFEKWQQLLASHGISVLHTIGIMNGVGADPWIDKYIFPGGWLPALRQLTTAAEQARLNIVDTENLWQHYAKTLAHWSANFQAHREQVVKMYDEKFARMWELYLAGSEGGFRWGGLQLWQVVMIKDKEAPWPLNREVGLDKA